MRLDNKATFPSHLINPKYKDKKWISKYIKAAWKDYKESYPDGFYNAKDKYHDIKLYMLGKQGITKYKRMIDPQKAANNDETWVNIDWNIIPIIPKFRRIALGVLKKSGYNVTAQAVDQMANKDRDKMYAKSAAKITLRDEFEKNNMDTTPLSIGEKTPNNIKELEMHMKFNYKHHMAKEIEQALQLIFDLNDYKNVRKKVIEDIHDYGMGGYKEFFDSKGSIKIKRVNPSNMIVSYSTDSDFKDIHYCGEVLEMSMGDLKQMAGDELTEIQYKEISEKLKHKNDKYHGRISGNEHQQNFDGQRVKVLDLEFYSVNDIILEERINKKGNKVVGRIDKAKKNTKSKKYSKTSYKVVYKGKWIIDSDFYFDCGLCTNMKRAKSRLTDTTLSYHLVAPDLYQMQTYSLGEQMRGIADQLQLAWYKLQNVMLRARPRGIMIEIGALENVPLGRAGKAMKPLDIIDLYNQTGNLVYRAVDEEGNPSAMRPITELNNGLGNEAAQYYDIINRNIQLLRDILGFNEITDGSTPDPRTLKGVATLAAESTNNALSYIKDAERGLTERLAYNLTLRIQDAAKQGTLKVYVKALGSDSIEFFKVSPHVTAHEYGIILEDKPTEHQKEQLNKRIEQALQAGQITIADSLLVENLENVKQAQEVLAYRIEQNIKKQQEQSSVLQQQNAEIQNQAAQNAEVAKQQTIQVETQSKLQLLQAKAESDAQLMDRKYEHEKELETIRTEGRKEQKEIEADSREVVAEMRELGSTPDKSPQDE